MVQVPHLINRTCFPSLALIIAFACPDRGALATAGMAEWQMPTPGGNLISHDDPYVEKHGTCLRAASGAEARVYVSKVRWWQFFNHYVVGGAEGGYFLFREPTGALERFVDRASMQKRLRELAPGKALSKRMLPQDGWESVWKQHQPRPTRAALEQQRRAEVQVCSLLKTKLSTEAVSDLDRDEYEILCLDPIAVAPTQRKNARK
jgi:hypothetical protein